MTDQLSVAEPARTDASATPRVTVVTQTRIRPGQEAAFAAWQDRIGGIVATIPGFIEQSVMPPRPPVQTDWVILQRFSNTASALSWLHSEQRLQLVQDAHDMLVGNDDVHLLTDSETGAMPSPVSAIISTRIKPGKEDVYRRWEQRMAATQARAGGFQGYRFEPPIPGVQEDWLAILRFDTEANLQSWLASPARLKLLGEANEFTAEVHLRLARTGFDQWFQVAGATGGSPAWRQNMLVLSLLYPVVFLFGAWVQSPLLSKVFGMPFWLSLFVGNVVSVILLNYLVPWTSQRFAWWLRAPNLIANPINLGGTAAMLGMYAISLTVFALLF
jgi:antibiotic biosynthesis monooxygenase (ABM) superfamily enzyme